MFGTRNDETVVELKDFPQSSIGAPCPGLVSTEHALCVAFYMEDRGPDWDGTSARLVGIDSSDETIALVVFERPSIHTFGPPNDEAFSGHRLSSKGLKPYGAYEVHNSQWISQLERMNSVHPYHVKDRFLEGKRHFILTFHDSTFECVARNYTFKIGNGSIKSALFDCVAFINA